MNSPAQPISTDEYNYFMNQSKMQETGRNVKCVFPKCDSVFWTDGPLKQHLTKTHNKSKKEKTEIFKGNSFEERREISEKQERRKDKIKKDTIENKENVSNIQKTEDRDAKFLNKVAPRKHIQNDCNTKKVTDISKENNQTASELINKMFGCFICDSKFSNEAGLTEHQSKCRIEKSKDISKGNRSPKLMRLDPHRNKYRQKEPDPVDTTNCEFCNSKFPTKVAHLEHIQFNCIKKCPFCAKILLSKDLLNHVSDGCDGKKKNIKRNFPDQDQKDYQARTLLLPIKKPKIQEDQDILLEVNEEKNHGKVLEGNKPMFDHESCSKSFAKEWNLTTYDSASHKLRADSKVHEENTHIEVREEKNHEKHLEENKPSSYCRICDKSFSKEWILINHCAAYHRPIVYEEKKHTKGQ